MAVVSHKRPRHSKGLNPNGRYKSLSIRVNSVEDALIESKLPPGTSKSAFLYNLIMSIVNKVD